MVGCKSSRLSIIVLLSLFHCRSYVRRFVVSARISVHFLDNGMHASSSHSLQQSKVLFASSQRQTFFLALWLVRSWRVLLKPARASGCKPCLRKMKAKKKRDRVPYVGTKRKAVQDLQVDEELRLANGDMDIGLHMFKLSHLSFTWLRGRCAGSESFSEPLSQLQSLIVQSKAEQTVACAARHVVGNGQKFMMPRPP